MKTSRVVSKYTVGVFACVVLSIFSIPSQVSGREAQGSSSVGQLTSQRDHLEKQAKRDVWQGNWHLIKGKILEKWGNLTHNDLLEAEGSREYLLGKIQEKHGEERLEVAAHLDKLIMEALRGASLVSEKSGDVLPPSRAQQRLVSVEAPSN